MLRAVCLSILAASTLAAVVPSKKDVKSRDNVDFHQAAKNWYDDTVAVSSFLDDCTDFSTDGEGRFEIFIANAREALKREKDELDWKATLEEITYFATNPRIDNAKRLLVTDHHFQQVVDNLGDMAAPQGTGNAPTLESRLALVPEINTGRCRYVLPSINAYFQEAGFGNEFQAKIPAGCHALGIEPTTIP